jgi:hypothetical protein
MLKVIGAVLVIGCGVVLGLGYVTELRRRCAALRAFTDALPALRREICDFLTPTQEAIEVSGVRFDSVREWAEAEQLERVLGRYGAEEQREAIVRAEIRLLGELEKLESESKSKGRVVAAGCISAGLMAVILLI